MKTTPQLNSRHLSFSNQLFWYSKCMMDQQQNGWTTKQTRSKESKSWAKNVLVPTFVPAVLLFWAGARESHATTTLTRSHTHLLDFFCFVSKLMSVRTWRVHHCSLQCENMGLLWYPFPPPLLCSSSSHCTYLVKTTLSASLLLRGFLIRTGQPPTKRSVRHVCNVYVCAQCDVLCTDI